MVAGRLVGDGLGAVLNADDQRGVLGGGRGGLGVGGGAQLGQSQVAVLAVDDSLAGGGDGVGVGGGGSHGGRDGEVVGDAGVDAAQERAVAGDGLAGEEQHEAEDALGRDVQHSVDDHLLVNGHLVAALGAAPHNAVHGPQQHGAEGQHVVQLADLNLQLGMRVATGGSGMLKFRT